MLDLLYGYFSTFGAMMCLLFLPCLLFFMVEHPHRAFFHLRDEHTFYIFSKYFAKIK